MSYIWSYGREEPKGEEQGGGRETRNDDYERERNEKNTFSQNYVSREQRRGGTVGRQGRERSGETGGTGGTGGKGRTGGTQGTRGTRRTRGIGQTGQ